MESPIDIFKRILDECNPIDAKFDRIRNICQEAISHPRNCDVGTADEMSQRFDRECAKYGYTKYSSCCGCPLDGERACYFTWATKPYEEPDEKEEGYVHGERQ